MAAHSLTSEARRENSRALAIAAGVSEQEAAARLEAVVLITHDSQDRVSTQLVAEITQILSRTLAVALKPTPHASTYAAELVIGRAGRQTSAPSVHVGVLADFCIISHEPTAHSPGVPIHPLVLLIVACYAAGAAIRRAVGNGMTNPPPDIIEIPFASFVNPSTDLSSAVDLEEAYFVGAGAIGNGFLWAARHVSLRGLLHLVDDDVVSSGNLQRQIWFDADDIDHAKSEQLSRKAQSFFPSCRLIPAVCRLQAHPKRTDGPWLKRLIVGVDSRRARRRLQDELPGEVFDASTTGSQEVVLHYNRQPSQLACMGCLYFADEREISQDQVIAHHLGIEIDHLRAERISVELAQRICVHHPQLRPEAIEGLAFDTLYKQLCSTGELRSVSGEQVIAPFAFVSVLAGAMLLLEIIGRQQKTSIGSSNEWHISPWWPPMPEIRRLRPRRQGCECCGRPLIRGVIDDLWSTVPST